MIAKDLGRWLGGMALIVVAAGITVPTVLAQQAPTRGRSVPEPVRANPPLSAYTGNQPTVRQVAIPVNPTDAVALVNGQKITRQQLADECVSRKGQEILETLIARTLIEQAIRARHIEVTPADVDREIDEMIARMTHGTVKREEWLAALSRERGISPAQLARDIVYPTLALRRLAEPEVEVTDDDLKKAYDANFGEQLRCRIIMVANLQDAKKVWEEVRRNPNSFEKIAQVRSIDETSRSIGGLIPPITRHAEPMTVSDQAFAQLVDGDSNDPDHKPKDGDFTGPIQVSEVSWVIMMREGVIAAQPDKDLNDPKVKKFLHDPVYDAKLKDRMAKVYDGLMRDSEIENRLTGHTKSREAAQTDPNLQPSQIPLMSDASQGSPRAAAGSTPPAQAQAGSVAGQREIIPAGLPSEETRRATAIKQSLKRSTDGIQRTSATSVTK